jgi:hypothetical protein
MTISDKERQRLVDELTGTPDELANRISTLLHALAANPMPDNATEDEKRHARRDHNNYQRELRIIQDRLAQDFGKLHGWKLTDKEFTAKVLAEHKMHGGRDDWGGDRRWPSFVNHPFFYRLNRRAVAVVAHDYNMPVTLPKAQAWATEHGLAVTLPTDFPSWWYPGSTTLVVLTPLGDVTEAFRAAHTLNEPAEMPT